LVRDNGFGEERTIWGEIRDYWMRRRGNGGARKYRLWPILLIIVLVIWIATGIYTVAPGELGVVLRFGKETGRSAPGLRFHLPAPIESVNLVNMAVIRRVEIGFRTNPRYRPVPEESLMLTGDENIVDAQAIVQYKVKDPSDYLFRVKDPDRVLLDSAEVSLRSVMGRTTIDDALTVGKVKIQEDSRQFLQQLLDTYQTGLLVVDFKLQVVDPPAQVKDSFNEVVRAREDQERLTNEARGYSEDIIPKARGEAEKRIRAAEAYKEQRMIKAKGDTERFLLILGEYQKAKRVTAIRLYIETMEQILPGANKIVLGPESGDNILQFLPLREFGGKQNDK
jgi:modulator of FtsH protease HflK